MKVNKLLTRSIEIDTMYVIGVNPIKSAKWTHNRPAQDSIGSEDQHRYQEEVKIRSVPI